LNGKQPTILSTTSLSLSSITTSGTVTANQITSRIYSPPTGDLDIQLRADQFLFWEDCYLHISNLSSNQTVVPRICRSRSKGSKRFIYRPYFSDKS
jgi:hypothetical protein